MSLTDQRKLPPDILTDRIVISAQATGAGGFVTRHNSRDTSYVIPVQGASALPIIGGLSQSVVEGPATKEFAPFLSFSRIETGAEGDYDLKRRKDKAVIKVRSMIRGLSVVSRLNVDYLQASLALTHQGARTQPVITTDGTMFGSIALDDEIIRVHIDEHMATLTTQQSIVDDFRKDRQRYAGRFIHDPDDKTRDGDVPHIAGSNYILYSIVDKIDVVGKTPGKPAKAQVSGHKVMLDGFGVIYFGELLVRPEGRRLSMMRIELGCRDEGRLEMCCAESMGEACPP